MVFKKIKTNKAVTDKVLHNPSVFTVVISETNTNVFVSLQNTEGRLIFQSSAGKVGMVGKKKKKTPLAGELLGKQVGEAFALATKRKLIGIIVKGSITQSVRGFLRGLGKFNLKFFFIENRVSLAHNGVRLKKQRKL